MLSAEMSSLLPSIAQMGRHVGEGEKDVKAYADLV